MKTSDEFVKSQFNEDTPNKLDALCRPLNEEEIKKKKAAQLGTIHILRKHLYSTKQNFITKFFIKSGFFRQNKRISFSTLRIDKTFMV